MPSNLLKAAVEQQRLELARRAEKSAAKLQATGRGPGQEITRSASRSAARTRTSASRSATAQKPRSTSRSSPRTRNSIATQTKTKSKTTPEKSAKEVKRDLKRVFDSDSEIESDSHADSDASTVADSGSEIDEIQEVFEPEATKPYIKQATHIHRRVIKQPTHVREEVLPSKTPTNTRSSSRAASGRKRPVPATPATPKPSYSRKEPEDDVFNPLHVVAMYAVAFAFLFFTVAFAVGKTRTLQNELPAPHSTEGMQTDKTAVALHAVNPYDVVSIQTVYVALLGALVGALIGYFRH